MNVPSYIHTLSPALIMTGQSSVLMGFSRVKIFCIGGMRLLTILTSDLSNC